MSTRALQIDFIMAGLRDPDTDEVLSGGSVEFYEAGTTTAKNVWTEKEKTNAYTSYTLDSNGQAQLYGDGIYKIVAKDADGNTEHTWDDVKIEANEFSVVTKTSSYTVTPDDDVIITNGSLTLTFGAVASFTRPIHVVNKSSLSNATFAFDGSEELNGETSYSLTPSNTITLWPDGDGGTWRADPLIYKGEGSVQTIQINVGNTPALTHHTGHAKASLQTNLTSADIVLTFNDDDSSSYNYSSHLSGRIADSDQALTQSTSADKETGIKLNQATQLDWAYLDVWFSYNWDTAIVGHWTMTIADDASDTVNLARIDGSFSYKNGTNQFSSIELNVSSGFLSGLMTLRWER